MSELIIGLFVADLLFVAAVIVADIIAEMRHGCLRRTQARRTR